MPTVAQEDRPTLEHFAQFALVLRIQQSRNGAPADGKTVLGLPTYALIKDILMSRLEIEAEVGPQEYVHAQGFADLGKALAASRALQLAFEGFRGAVPSARVNVSLVLDSFEAEQASPSVEQKDLLDSAKPSQVLITQAFYKRIAHCQPLALRSFPPRAGVYEFLWTSEARLNELQSQPGLTPTLVSETAQSEATVITVTGQPATAAFQSALTDFEPPSFLEHSSGPGHRALAWMRPRLPMITIGASAVILLAICYLVIVRPHSGNRFKVVAPATAAPPLVRSAPPPSTSQPPTTPSPGSHLTPAPTPPKPAVTGKSGTPPAGESPRPTNAPAAGADDQAPPATPTVPKPGSRLRECSIAGLIPNYLGLAEGNRIKGNYDAATREYNEVLACEPNNREAQSGLRRTKDSERLNGIRQ